MTAIEFYKIDILEKHTLFVIEKNYVMYNKI